MNDSPFKMIKRAIDLVYRLSGMPNLQSFWITFLVQRVLVVWNHVDGVGHFDPVDRVDALHSTLPYPADA